MEIIKGPMAGQGPKEPGPNYLEQQVVISDVVHRPAPEMVLTRPIIILQCPRGPIKWDI
jgi:hypothetical protein